MLPRNLSFVYNGTQLEIVRSFKYLGIVFTVGGSFAEAQHTLAGQAQKAIFQLHKYLYKFTFIPPKYTQLQKKPISHFSGQFWKTELRNENMCIP